MQSAYIETAELKGLSAFDIIRKHALPNAIAPIVNVVMLNSPASWLASSWWR